MSPVRSTARLTRLIRHVDEVGKGDTRRHDRLPDGRTLLIFRAHDAGHGDLTLTGPRTRASFKASSGVAAVIVRIKPGWSRALFGVAAGRVAPSAACNPFSLLPVVSLAAFHSLTPPAPPPSSTTSFGYYLLA